MSWDPNEPPPPYPGNFHQSNNFNPQQPNNFNSSQFNIPSNNIVHPFAPSHNIQHSFEPHGYPTDPRKPPNIPTEIWSWFVAVDEDGNGKITANELERSLLNADWSGFNSETCRLMVGMFDQDQNGTIDIHEFSALWSYIKQWKNCFDRFDTDRSGTIDPEELHSAFQTFGYNLSKDFSKMCIRLFDSKDRNCITLDDFIQICVMLHVFTAKFREKDKNQTGIINIYYEDFIKMALDNTIV